MSYTSTDLTSVEAAIVALATGERHVRVTINNKTIEYAQTDMAKLEHLRGVMQAEIANAAGTGNRSRYVQTSKGYY
jgi:hypothetical protein